MEIFDNNLQCRYVFRNGRRLWARLKSGGVKWFDSPFQNDEKRLSEPGMKVLSVWILIYLSVRVSINSTWELAARISAPLYTRCTRSRTKGFACLAGILRELFRDSSLIHKLRQRLTARDNWKRQNNRTIRIQWEPYGKRIHLDGIRDSLKK